MIDLFSIARLPRIEFGRGSMQKLPGFIQDLMQKTRTQARPVLLVSGANSVQASRHWTEFLEALRRQQITYLHTVVSGEPSPQLIDDRVKEFAAENISLVVGIGGGSVLDAAKAIAGLLHVGHSVMDYLEGVGPEQPYAGPAVPFIAVPTTAGTGSEATKNAVLSQQGEGGFKKSFRDDQLVAEYAVVDPEWLSSCPQNLIAANGMDALTQLMESYVSIRANPMMDALNLSGLQRVSNSLLAWYHQGEAATAAMDDMAYAAMLSGITLAQTGLGSVHGLASPLGAFFPIPHGVACGTLVAKATEVNIQALKARAATDVALDRYQDISEILHQHTFDKQEEALASLVELLHNWCQQMQLPRLNAYGMTEKDIERVVENSRGSSMKTNPVVLQDNEIQSLLMERL